MSTSPNPELADSMPLSTGENRPVFPDGTFTIVTAAALERLGYYMLMSCLIMFIMDSLHEGHEVAFNLFAAYVVAAFSLPLLGGLLGDFIGHGRALILGAALIAASMAVLVVPVEEGSGVAWIGVSFGLLLLALGRGLFPVSALASLADLHEVGPCRVPAAGAFTVLHVGINLTALPAPFLVDLLREALLQGPGLDDVDVFRVIFAFALQPVIGALIVAAARRRVFARAEQLVRQKVRDRDPTPLPDGAARYAVAAIPAVLVAFFLYELCYSHAMGALNTYGFQVLTEGGSAAGDMFQSINPLVVVLLGPVAAIVYGRVARRRKLPLVTVLGVGAALAAAGVGLFLLGVVDLPSELPLVEIGYEVPVVSPMAALLLISMGEILAVPLLFALVVSAGSRRFRGLLLGAAYAVIGFANQLDRLLQPEMEGLPAVFELGLVLFLAVLAGGLTFLFGAVLRRPTERHS